MSTNTQTLIKKMAAIFEKNQITKFYKDDFYKHDLDFILNDALKDDVLLWSLRECGTSLSILNTGDETPSESALYYLRDPRSLHYEIDFNKGCVKKINSEDANGLIHYLSTRKRTRIPRRSHFYNVLDSYKKETKNAAEIIGKPFDENSFDLMVEQIRSDLKEGSSCFIIEYPDGKWSATILMQKTTFKVTNPAQAPSSLPLNSKIHKLKITSNHQHGEFEDKEPTRGEFFKSVRKFKNRHPIEA